MEMLTMLSPLEQVLHNQSRQWLKAASPILFQYALWALNIAQFGLSLMNKLCIHIRMESTLNPHLLSNRAEFEMKSGLVCPLSLEMLMPQESHCIVLLVEFLIIPSTGTAAATVVHQLQHSISELPSILQNRQLARLLQRNWANRLFHRLSQGVW
ncbi:hypothetical protein QCA50_018887 [Cerrena zonata]|uniref:Uncharacterized protein n=1 Tax=Cerrena zonata TaxID=2478898 RepID=A0AAW0FGQ3_9APHY